MVRGPEDLGQAMNNQKGQTISLRVFCFKPCRSKAALLPSRVGVSETSAARSARHWDFGNGKDLPPHRLNQHTRGPGPIIHSRGQRNLSKKSGPPRGCDGPRRLGSATARRGQERLSQNHLHACSLLSLSLGWGVDFQCHPPLRPKMSNHVSCTTIDHFFLCL